MGNLSGKIRGELWLTGLRYAGRAIVALSVGIPLVFISENIAGKVTIFDADVKAQVGESLDCTKVIEKITGISSGTFYFILLACIVTTLISWGLTARAWQLHRKTLRRKGKEIADLQRIIDAGRIGSNLSREGVREEE